MELNQVLNSTYNSVPQSTSIFNPVDPYNIIGGAGGISQNQGSYKLIANSLYGLHINKESLLSDATTRAAEPFVGARPTIGTFTQSQANYDLSDGYNKYLSDIYEYRANPVARSSAQNFGALHRNSYNNYVGIGSDNLGGSDNAELGISHRLGVSDANRMSQRSDPIFIDQFPKRQTHATRSVYLQQFPDYNGFDSDRVKDVQRDRENYIDSDIAKKYARDKVANISSSHHAFLYRDPYESQFHQPYVEANVWLDLPNL